MRLQESGEMYLETIFLLSQKNPRVRAIDVGQEMGYSKPSVSRAVGLLKEGGFVIADKDGCLHLTEEGLDVAKRTYECHTVLTDFFKKLGIPDEVAVEDACRIEHCISKETLSAIKRLNETL